MIVLLLLTLLGLAAGSPPGSALAPAVPAAAPSTPVGNRTPGPAGSQMSVEGVVTANETGRAIGGATVELFAEPGPDEARARVMAGDPIGEPLARGRTGAAGRFRLEVASGRRVVLVAWAPGHERRQCGRPFVVVAERDRGECPLPTGRTIAGRVLAPSGAPAAGALVVARNPAGDAARWDSSGRISERFGFPSAARTGGDGRFVIEGAPRAPVDLHVFTTAAAPILVAQVRRDLGVEVRLSPGVALDGRVVGPDDAPAPGAWVLAGRDGWEGIARADAKGAFRLERLQPGERSIVAVAPEAPPLAPSAAVRVELAGGKVPPPSPLLLKLRRGGSVRVRVVDQSTRLPIAGASATLSGVDGIAGRRLPTTPRVDARWSAVDEKGVARFDGVAAGTVRIGAEADGCFDVDTRSVDLPAGGTREITMALQRAAGLAGVVRDEGGAPIAGALLVVLADQAPPGRRSYGASMPLSGVEPATTKADGRFAFDRLPPGRDLKVRVTLERFAPGAVAVAPLQPGERRSGLEVRLARGAAIAGHVVGPGGAPVPGAEVIATRQIEGEGIGFTMYGSQGRAGSSRRDRRAPPGERQLPAVLADAEGRFRLIGAVDGVWSLEVGAPGFAVRVVAGVRVEGGGDSDAGEIALQPGVRVRGRVVGPAAEPIGLAKVTVGSQADWFFLEMQTGADGRFESDDLEPGRPVTVRVRAEGFAVWEQDGLIPSAEEIAIALRPASSVSGRVIDAETRQPLADFAVAVARIVEMSGGGSSSTWMDLQADQTFHGEDGVFSFEGLTPGPAAIHASAPGYRPTEVRDVAIPEAGRLDDLVLALGRAVTVSGSVTDEAGAPVADVLVTRRETRAAGGASVGFGDGGVTTDADGLFMLTGLEPGTFVLDFNHVDYEPESQEIEATGDRAGVRVRLVHAATLSGVVVRDPGGTPVGGAVVRARAVGDSAFSGIPPVTSGTDGRFAVAGLAAGRYVVEVQAPGLRSGSVDDVVVARGAPPAAIEIRLKGGVALRGVVQGVPEEHRGRLVVNAREADDGMRGPGAVDGTGRFELGGLAPGPVTLSFYDPRAFSFQVSRRIEIPDGVESYETTVTVEEGHVVTGTIRRAGAPIGGAQVRFWNRARRTSVSATTDTSGTYRAAGVLPGETLVYTTQWTLGLMNTRTVMVDGDTTVDIDFPVAAIAGVVREAGSARPLEGATVTVTPVAGEGSAAGGSGNSGSSSDSTDAAGAWRIEGIDPGTYTVTARHAGHAYATRTVEVPKVEAGEAAAGAPPVILELEPSSPLVFRVVDGVTGQPVRAITCLALAGGGDPLDPTGASMVAAYDGRMTAGPEGDFRIDTLAPGSYRLVIEATDLSTETIHDLAVPGPQFTVTLVPPGTIRVRAAGIPAGTTTRAVALDAAGRPMHLVAWTPLPFVTLRPDAPSTLPNLRPGAYRLRVALPGGDVEVPVQVKAGEITDVTLP